MSRLPVSPAQDQDRLSAEILDMVMNLNKESYKNVLYTMSNENVHNIQPPLELHAAEPQ